MIFYFFQQNIIRKPLALIHLTKMIAWAIIVRENLIFVERNPPNANLTRDFEIQAHLTAQTTQTYWNFFYFDQQGSCRISNTKNHAQTHLPGAGHRAGRGSRHHSVQRSRAGEDPEASIKKTALSSHLRGSFRSSIPTSSHNKEYYT